MPEGLADRLEYRVCLPAWLTSISLISHKVGFLMEYLVAWDNFSHAEICPV